ncbi:MAG TPA: FMN-binding glutamate synthase family protein [Chitinophagaceae bacterium]|nr:FMN-binding glutamate synthase family protein [Chitinophagaceae bacterium]
MRKEFITFSILSCLILLIFGYFFHWVFWLFILFGPIILLGLYDMVQPHHTIRRVYPFLGRFRYLMEDLRPKVYQYFVESDTDGKPINRVDRSTIYQRAKRDLDTQPFGTQYNTYQEGYEWLAHSVNPVDFHKLNKSPRVNFGGKQCTKPYSASILNVSAMSFGALGANAVEALNAGAKIGNFAHNTGEGGISPYHLKPGGDIIWQIGTAYFGCRKDNGEFDPDLFKKKSRYEQVKMIEIKLSQGAKPGHGGILPGVKNTVEIAETRHVKPYETVYSPTFHTAFTNPVELMEYVQELRNLCGGKPVGFKLCVGRQSEVYAMCKAMIETGIYPDFITVDGGEGGTGAAPPEFSNTIGMPFMDGLSFVHNTLVGFNIRDKMKLIGSGKILTGFHIARAMALGADTCNSARAMMLSLGCIQSLLCNTNKCPTGITTQDKSRQKGLVVEEKKIRVANYHDDTVSSCVELTSALGFSDPHEITRGHVFRRVFMNTVKTFEEIYPSWSPGYLLHENEIHNDQVKQDLDKAKTDRWR